MLTPWKESYDQPRQHIKKQRHCFANKGPSSQGYGFSRGHVWMGELDYKESWAWKNWCFWTVVLEKTLESPLDCKEIQPDHCKGEQSWIFIGRTDVEPETLILWPPDAKNWLIGKDPDAGKDWRQEETGDNRGWEGWMASLTQWTWAWVTPGVGDGQGGLACCNSWDHKESDTTEWLNWTERREAQDRSQRGGGRLSALQRNPAGVGEAPGEDGACLGYLACLLSGVRCPCLSCPSPPVNSIKPMSIWYEWFSLWKPKKGQGFKRKTRMIQAPLNKQPGILGSGRSWRTQGPLPQGGLTESGGFELLQTTNWRSPADVP